MSVEMLRPSGEAADERMFGALAAKWRGMMQERDAGDARCFRPAPDAAALRHLLSLEGAGLPPDVMTHVWRSLCGDAMMVRGLKTVHVAGGDMAASIEGARGYFGFGPMLSPAADVRDALEKASESASSLACVPWPEHAGAGQWWPMLNENRFRGLAILDGWPTANNETPRMAVVGLGEVETSGQDDMLATAHDDTHAAERCLSEADLPGEVLARARSLTLIRINEFVAPDDRRLDLARRAGLDGLRIVGVRPRP